MEVRMDGMDGWDAGCKEIDGMNGGREERNGWKGLD